MLLELHAVSSAGAPALASAMQCAAAAVFQVEQLQLMLEAFMNADDSRDRLPPASRKAARKGRSPTRPHPGN